MLTGACTEVERLGEAVDVTVQSDRLLQNGGNGSTFNSDALAVRSIPTIPPPSGQANPALADASGLTPLHWAAFLGLKLNSCCSLWGGC